MRNVTPIELFFFSEFLKGDGSQLRKKGNHDLNLKRDSLIQRIEQKEKAISNLYDMAELGDETAKERIVGRNDPRADFMRQLKSSIEPSGSIVVFNAPFEKSRMKECAELLPEYKSWVSAVNGRIVDLLNPFKAFNFYHPDQCGSASMKSVLPALTGKDYRGLEIQEGGAASREFVRVTFGDVSEPERKRVRRALELYCGQDTEGMVWILDVLRAA